MSSDDPDSSDENDSSETAPFKTINRAAEQAGPGTRVIIRGGIYRECVTPCTDGSDSEHMISFEAAPGEKVIIRSAR